jgi:hypothetical protein
MDTRNYIALQNILYSIISTFHGDGLRNHKNGKLKNLNTVVCLVETNYSQELCNGFNILFPA